MKHQCPTCRRTFGEPGFCPFDRGPLVPVSEQVTIISEEMAAMKQPSPTTIDPPKSTLPLTRSSGVVIPPATEDLTNVKNKIAAISAAGDAGLAMKQFEKGRDEYDQLIGQTLDGRYYIDKKIGEGGMGVVFAARHAVIERPLAIKVLKREVMRDSATIRRFEQEAKAASRIGHPNIVDVTDFGTTPTGMTYQVMEYVKGETLGAALRKSAPFPLVRIVRVGTQIARALGAAHDKGIVHRDLKPENVFLIDRDNRPDFVKILDFGIAKVTPIDGNVGGPRLTRAGSVFGTPEYMAPEQAAGKSDTDGRVDVYALGIILYEMTTGRVPHRGDTMVRTLAMQMLDPIELPSRVRPDLAIAPELEAVIMKALAKKRDDRYPTMATLLADLDNLQQPVGLSLTGSPVYALVPLPPGADGAAPVGSGVMPVTESLHPAVPVPHTAPGTYKTPRPRSETTRRVHEPEFVASDKPLTFEHVFAEEATVRRSRRWPLLLLFSLILGGAGGALALVVKSRQRVNQQNAVPDAAPIAATSPDAAASAGPDGAPQAVVAPDGGVVLDAGVVAIIVDGDTTVVQVNPDGGTDPGGTKRPRRDGGPDQTAVTPNGRGTYLIQVLTKPEGAELYVGGQYSGPAGTKIEKPAGTKIVVTCKKPGYKPGNVSLVYDGKTEAKMCVLSRTKLCVSGSGEQIGIKNPFDHCEEPKK